MSTAEAVAEARLAAAWSALAAHLDARRAQLSREVREYPTPIARCDQQLAKLLEQRSGVHERRELMARLAARPGADPARPDRAMAEEVLRAGPATDEDAERALRAALRDALARERG